MTNPELAAVGSRRNVPHDLGAERYLLGAMLLSADARRQAVRLVAASDFYRPAYSNLFAVIAELHEHGGVDLALVVDSLRRRGQLESFVVRSDGIDVAGIPALVALERQTPATSNAGKYAGIVAELAVLRRAIAVASDLVDAAYAVPSDVGEFIAVAENSFRSLTLPTQDPATVWTLDEFVDAATATYEWVIPGFIERGDRVVLTAGEGAGKTYLTRQLAIASSQGINPFTFRPIQPIRSLLVDLENPASIVRRHGARMLSVARAQARGAYDPDRVMLWHEPAGIDIRSRVDFGKLDDVITLARPDLVCIGPLYKLFRKDRRETDEDAALDVTQRLDDLRTRHGFALVIEHHAPNGGGGHRDLRPFGSSVWQRWPEFGPALYPHPKARSRELLLWGDWRGPRDERPWPTSLAWGTTWPWEFTWDDGVPANPLEEML